VIVFLHLTGSAGAN